ncbi:MAG: hypothetical protein IJZ76_07095, partial [Lachnospiraceae bacterium]|nr:hypothetical protein [Lachnospiraceae bacterium]
MAETFEDKNDEFIIGIEADLVPNGNYGSSFVFVSSSKLCIIVDDESADEKTVLIPFSEIEKVSVKRLYGNAIMRVKLKSGVTRDVLRFTFSVAVVCETAAEFVNKIIGGDAVESALEAVKSVFKNLGSYCPKCGSKLPEPGAKCTNCGGKAKLGSTIIRFIKPHLGMLAFSLFLSVLTTGASLVPPLITQTLVDDVIPNRSMQGLIIIIICYLALHFVNSGINVIKSYMLRITGNTIIGDLKKEIYRKAQFLPMKFYDKTSTGSVVTRINSDTVTLQSFMMTVTQSAVVNILTVIGIVIMMLAMNWKLTLLALIPVPLIVWLSTFLSAKIKPYYRRIWRRNSSLSGLLTDTIPSIRVVKSFSREDDAINKFSGNVDSWLAEDRKLGKLAALLPSFIGFLVMFGTAIIWFAGGVMVITDPEEL